MRKILEIIFLFFIFGGCIREADNKKWEEKAKLEYQRQADYIAHNGLYCSLVAEKNSCFCFVFGVGVPSFSWAPDQACGVKKLFEIEIDEDGGD